MRIVLCAGDYADGISMQVIRQSSLRESYSANANSLVCVRERSDYADGLVSKVCTEFVRRNWNANVLILSIASGGEG